MQQDALEYDILAVDVMTRQAHTADSAGITMYYGVHETPFGAAFIAITGSRICQLFFIDGNSLAMPLSYLEKKWQPATCHHSQQQTAPFIAAIFSRLQQPLRLHIIGTAFQIKVWQALLKLKSGQLYTYQALAKKVASHPRPVGQALKCNPIAFVIPCHRIINANGELHGYRWGLSRKRAILAWENKVEQHK